MQGALETEVCIGDIWQVGTDGAQVQVSAPASPALTVIVSVRPVSFVISGAK